MNLSLGLKVPQCYIILVLCWTLALCLYLSLGLEPQTSQRDSLRLQLQCKTVISLTHTWQSCQHIWESVAFFFPQELVYLGPNIFSIYQDHFDFWPNIIRSCLPSHLQTSLVQCHEQNVQMQFHFHHPNNLSKSCSTQASAGSLLKCSHNAIHNCF